MLLPTVPESMGMVTAAGAATGGATSGTDVAEETPPFAGRFDASGAGGAGGFGAGPFERVLIPEAGTRPAGGRASRLDISEASDIARVTARDAIWHQRLMNRL